MIRLESIPPLLISHDVQGILFQVWDLLLIPSSLKEKEKKCVWGGGVRRQGGSGEILEAGCWLCTRQTQVQPSASHVSSLSANQV